MPDLPDIKAKITIEYDGSGVEKAKEDLASLAEITGGTLVESVGNASDALSGMGGQFAISAEHANTLGLAAGNMEKPLLIGQHAASLLSETTGGLSDSFVQAGTSLQEFTPMLPAYADNLGRIAEPMYAVTEVSGSMQHQLAGVNDSFALIGDTTAQAMPLLPQYAESLHSVSTIAGASAENMAVFQDALVNPYPFQMIQSHLDETGQSWTDFTSSIGDNNTAMLHEMATNADVSHAYLGGVAQDFVATGESAKVSAGYVDEFQKTWDSMAAPEGINKFGGVGSALYGPEMGAIAEGGGGLGGILGGAASDLGGVLGAASNFLMPLMAVQMVGMAVQQVGQSIYDSAAIAEGPAAHSIGTFTGTVDALGQSFQKSGAQFSEAFGQQLLPTLNAMNDVVSQPGGMGGLAGALGATSSFLANTGLAVGGLLTMTTGVGMPLGMQMATSGFEGLINQGASLFGFAQPFQGPGPSSPAQQQQLAMQQQLAANTAMMMAQANDPSFLAAQAYLGSQTQIAQQAQQSYTVSHYGGTTGATDPYNSIIQSELVNSIYGSGSYGGNPDPNAAFFNSIPSVGGGCFPAGTQVLMADGHTRAIETLGAGHQVIAHDGTQHLIATVGTLITLPPKQTYALTFSDGNTLTLTDSHPISTPDGWKSLSPAATSIDNPDLATSLLKEGDLVHTVTGVCQLVAIQARAIAPVYNISVGEPHTYYAEGILVHNKALGQSIMSQILDVSMPQSDMRNSNLMQSLVANFSSADLTHTFTATASWVGQDLENTFTGAASWVGQNLSNAFTAVANWAGQNLSQDFTAAANWAGQNLQKDFTAAASWASQNLSQDFTASASWASKNLAQDFTAVASWIGNNLEKTFTGAADWIGQNLEHTFTGVASWIGQGLQQTFTAVASFVGLPGYAQGIVDSPSTHVAVVGENGPEIMVVPQGASIYPSMNGAGGGSGIALGGASGQSANQGNITLQLMIDSAMMAEATLPYLSSQIMLTSGRRY